MAKKEFTVEVKFTVNIEAENKEEAEDLAHEKILTGSECPEVEIFE